MPVQTMMAMTSCSELCIVFLVLRGFLVPCTADSEIEKATRSALTQAHEFLAREKKEDSRPIQIPRVPPLLSIKKHPESSRKFLGLWPLETPVALGESEMPASPAGSAVGPHHFSHCTATVWTGQRKAEWGYGLGKRQNPGQDRDLRAQSNGLCLFAIFDGHGTKGDVISNAVRNKVRELFEAKMMSSTVNLQTALDSVSTYVLNFDEAQMSGSTGAGVIISDPSTFRDVFIFNIGDSRVVWGKEDGSIVGQSADHDCANPREVSELYQPCSDLRMTCDRNASGHVMEQFYNAKMNRVLRSFGDLTCHGARKDRKYSQVVVQSVPREKVNWFIVASDGVLGPAQERSKHKKHSQSLLQYGFSSKHALQFLLDAADDDARRASITKMLDMGSRIGKAEITIKNQTIEYHGTGDDQSIIAVRLGDHNPIPSLSQADEHGAP